jgi:ParB-like chromosome segregation protein Spo0J
MTARKPAFTGTHQIHADLTTLTTDIGQLTELPGNPRQGDVAAIARSLRVFGQRKPVTARKTGVDANGNPVGYVTAGNHTLLAARDELGWTHLAVVWVDEDETTANAWALADNRLSEIGKTDQDLLVDMLNGISDPDLLAATAYSQDDLAKLLGASNPNTSPVLALTFALLVTCADEEEQRKLMERFDNDGIPYRALMT